MFLKKEKLSKVFGFVDRKTFKLNQVTHIDIGCGNWKEEGYYGLDIFDGPLVDQIIDLEKDSLPFRDNSIEHAVTFHALEHIQNLEWVIREIWRVLKPNAQLFICVPYFDTHINFANIFHKQSFNEHSFRFYTSEKYTQCLPERIWKYHFTPTWGLKGSANTVFDTEFKCLKIEFDYFPEYKKLTDIEKEKARLSKHNVVHNICFYLQTIKKDEPVIEIKGSDIIVPRKRRWMIDNGW